MSAALLDSLSYRSVQLLYPNENFQCYVYGCDMGYMYNKGPYFIGSGRCAIIFLIGLKKRGIFRLLVLFVKFNFNTIDFSCEKRKKKDCANLIT